MRIRALFDSAMQEPATERVSFVRRAAGIDTDLADEVLRLIELASTPTEEMHLDLGEAPADSETPAPSRSNGSGIVRLESLRSHPERRLEILGKIGEGGMGAVLRVRDQALGRNLAMKVILGQAGANEVIGGDTPPVDPELLQRFLEEAQIAGQLDHPGVVPVHELGLDDRGRAYFTMRLVRGDTAEKVFAQARAGESGWTITRALEVILKVCDTVAFAHQKGVLHRDLKPTNVMVGRFGEVYVLDWGLAKVLGQTDRHDLRIQPSSTASHSKLRTDRSRTTEDNDSPVMTMDGAIVGTPCYMAPEQAEGRVHELDQRADVYAVGAMLYELLTGSRPYVRPGARMSPYQVLAAVSAGPPAAVHAIARGVPAELAAVCEKAMAREIADRYVGMRALADDLRAYLEKRVVRAYRTGPLVELAMWVRRNRMAASVVVIAAAIVALLFIAILMLRQASEANAASARANLYVASMQAAGRSLASGHVREAQVRVAIAPDEYRGAEWHWLNFATDSSQAVLGSHRQEAIAVSMSRDGSIAATASWDRSVILWNTAEKREIARLQQPFSHAADAVAISPGGTSLVAHSASCIAVWTLEPAALAWQDTIGEAGSPRSHSLLAAAWSRNSDWLALATSEGLVLRDSATGIQQRRVECGFSPRYALDTVGGLFACAVDGRWLLYSIDGGSIRSTGSLPGMTVAVSIDPAGKRISALVLGDPLPGDTTMRPASIVVLDALRSGQKVGEHVVPPRREQDVHWLASTTDSFVLNVDHALQYLEVQDSGILMDTVRLTGHTSRVRGVAAAESGVCVSVSDDCSVRIWHPAHAAHRTLLRQWTSWPAGRLTVSPDGSRLMASDGRELIFFGADDPSSRTVVAQHTAEVMSLAASGSGRFFFSSDSDYNILVWENDRDGTRLVERIRAHDPRPWNPAGYGKVPIASPAVGDSVFSVSWDGLVKRWAPPWQTGQVLADVGRPVGVIAVSADGSRVAYSTGGYVFVRAADGTAVWDLGELHDHSVTALALSPSGTLLGVSGSQGHVSSRIQIIAVESGERLADWTGHNSLWTLRFLDEDRVLSVGDELRVWSLRMGDCVAILPVAGVDAVPTDGGRSLFVSGGSIRHISARPNTAEADNRILGWQSVRRVRQVMSSSPLTTERLGMIERMSDVDSETRESLRQSIVRAGEDAGILNLAAWDIVKRSGQPVADYRRALEMATRAFARNNVAYIANTLAAAHYRLGNPAEARAIIRRANGDTPSARFEAWEDVAFWAMIEAVRGDCVAAVELTAELERRMSSSATPPPDEMVQLAREAVRTIVLMLFLSPG